MSKETTAPDSGNNDLARLRSLLEGISLSGALPLASTELRLLELDPQRAHVFWSIEPAREDAGKRQILRVYDITGTGDISRPDQSYDIPVHGREGRWYLDFWRGDRVFVAELGYLDRSGALERLALSNEVHTPPSGPATTPGVIETQFDPQGLPVQTEQSAPPENEVSDTLPLANESFDVDEDPGLDPTFPLVDHESNPAREDMPSDEEAIPLTLVPAAPLAAGEAMVACVEEDSAREDEANELEELFPAADILDACITENAAALEAFYREVEQHQPTESPMPAHRGEEPPVATPAPRESRATPAKSRELKPAPATPLEQIAGWSSLLPAGGQDDLLELHAELHVYGRAKPGSNLTLHGQIIQLRPDGSFSIRRKIPSGSVVLPLLAKSAP